MEQKVEIATFAAGCFWSVEDAFMKLPGVIKTRVGYTGGHTANPTYENVCSDTTGHAEALAIWFDPIVISYESLLKTFFEIHDPTQYMRQGPDVGSQYRSAIFTQNDTQKSAAEDFKNKLESSKKYSEPIVTEIIAASAFYDAEEYHQKYFEKTGLKVCH